MATTKAAPGKKGLINFDFLQKLGKVLMTVIAVMPAAGLMISLGKLVQMGGGDVLDGNCHDLFLLDRYCFYCKAVCTRCQCLRKELRKSCNAPLCVPSTTFTKNLLLRCRKRRKFIFDIENSCKNCGVGLFLLRKVTQT